MYPSRIDVGYLSVDDSYCSDDDSSVHEILSCKIDKFGEEEDVDEDKLARQMVKMMKKHAGSVSKFLIERSSLIDSICWLARHIPLCVLHDLREDVLSSTCEQPTSEQRSVDKGLPVSIIECKSTNETQLGTGSCSEIYQESHGEKEAMPHDSLCVTPYHKGMPMALPYASYHKSAILFVDISGFTKLSQILNVEHLSKVSLISLCPHGYPCSIEWCYDNSMITDNNWISTHRKDNQHIL